MLPDTLGNIWKYDTDDIHNMVEDTTINILLSHFSIEYEHPIDSFDMVDILECSADACFNEKSVKQIACEIRDIQMIQFLRNYRNSFNHEQYVTTYYKSIQTVRSRFKRNFVEGYKLAIRGDDYLFQNILSIQYGLLGKLNIPGEQLIYFSLRLCFEYVLGYASCVLESEVREFSQEIGVNLSDEKLLDSKTQKQMDDKQINVEVSPQITVSPQIYNSPTINVNLPEVGQSIEKKTNINLDAEKATKKWKNRALFTFGVSLIVTILLVIISLNRWFLSAITWSSLERYEVIKWVGIMLGITWNGFIMKILYDRFFDPSKEKAYRDGLYCAQG